MFLKTVIYVKRGQLSFACTNIVVYRYGWLKVLPEIVDFVFALVNNLELCMVGKLT